MTNEERTFEVWVYGDSPDWLAENNGEPWARFLADQTETEACTHAGRLFRWSADKSVEVRDAVGDTVVSFGPERPPLSVSTVPVPKGYVRPRRRLGTRGE